MIPSEKQKVKEIKALLKPETKILITGHTNPDGDAVGASLATYLFFKKKGYNTTIVMPDEMAESVSWLESAKEIIVNEDENKEIVAQKIKEADVIFCIDFNEPRRLRSLKEPILDADATKIMIDHHPQPAPFVDFMFSDTEKSSASEYVYYFLEEFDSEAIDKNIAECLFMGIATDTGSFYYSSATAPTFEVASKLMKFGIDKQKILNNTFDKFSADRMRLMGFALSRKMVVMPEYKTAYISLMRRDFERFNYQFGDHENFVNLPLSIKGIEVSAFFMELEDSIRISLRSKNDFDVNELARKHFDGGGHQKAAGGRSYKSLKYVIRKFEEVIKEADI